MGAPAELVAVHGWGMNGAVWETFGERLGAAVRLSALDLPGHGGAPFDPTATGLADWAQACLAAAPQRAPWLGWSLGALVAIQAALLAPARVAGLILVGGTPRFLQGADWPCGLTPETLEQFRTDLVRDPQSTLQRFLALQVRGSEGASDSLRLLRRRLAARPAPHPEALDAGLALLAGSDLRDQLAALGCPSLWLLGERDTLIPRTLGERLPRYLAEGEVRVIPGAGHAPFLSHPGAVATAIASFLGASDSPRGDP